MITPVFTEKSLKLAKFGKYTFWITHMMTKLDVKNEVNTIFGVHVKTVKTITTHGEAKKNNRGMKVKVMPTKKAIVTLKTGEKIEVFEEPKK